MSVLDKSIDKIMGLIEFAGPKQKQKLPARITNLDLEVEETKVVPHQMTEEPGVVETKAKQLGVINEEPINKDLLTDDNNI